MADGAHLYPGPILHVMQLLKQHGAVSSVHEPIDLGSGSFRIALDISVELPSRAKAKGESHTGVRQIENVFLEFGPDWPIIAPTIFLRTDFPRTLPHINPHIEGEPVPPCVFQGDLSELLHREGLDGLVDQVVDWLAKAAADNLIDQEQGWEPTRRDESAGNMAFNATNLINLLPSDGKILCFHTVYGIFGGGHEDYHFMDVAGTPIRKIEKGFWQQDKSEKSGRFIFGGTYTFLATAPHENGRPKIIDKYEPETVKTLPDLLAKADRLGINSKALQKSIEDFHALSQKKTFGWPDGFKVGIILAANRPSPIIGSPGQTTELLPYIMTFRSTTHSSLVKSATVRPCFHEKNLSPELLAKTSGMETADITYPITLVGCGSLGSKIGMHLGRSGFGNITFVDDDWFSSHNAARHALLPHGMIISPAKPTMMRDAFSRLGHINTTAYCKDAALGFRKDTEFKKMVSASGGLILDASASLKVLEASCQSSALNSFEGRLARVVLYGEGDSCVLLLEGKNRTVRMDDLQAYLFARCITNADIRERIAGRNTGPTRLYVGQNCSSVTTIMPDSKISRAASLATMQLEEWLRTGFPEDSKIHLGLAQSQGIGMTWDSSELSATTVIPVASDGGWEIRVLKPVVDAIDADAKKWGALETGGALVGHVSLACRCIIVASLIPAPPDSKRTRSEFVLGTEGLESALQAAHSDSLAHLHFVGTWHSHPMGGGLSGTDFKTLNRIAKDWRGLPAISLVWTPKGFQCEVKSF